MTIETTYPGLRVLDLATNIAGPFAAMILGDMGADVIKVERPPIGDDTRALPPQWQGEATVFHAVNRNKRSVLIDMKTAEGREALLRLAEEADVVIESFPPGVAEKLRLTFADFKARNPAILLCSISAFGDGPIGRAMPGYDALVQAVSGLMSFTGAPGMPSVRIAPSVVDLTTGMWSAMGLMAALARRAVGGGAEHVRTCLIDSAMTLMNHQLIATLATGQAPEKLGSGAPSAAPYRVYAASDGELMIATASDPQFQRLCGALGLAAMAADPRYAAMEQRLAHRAAIDAAIEQVIARNTLAHWTRVLGEAGISTGEVNSVPQALGLAVVQERHLLVPAPDSRTGADGDLPHLRLPIDRDGCGVRAPAPRLDAQGGEVRAHGWLPRA